jgi:hypothetical protein
VLINVFVSGNSAKTGGGINNQGDENGQNGSSPKLINVTISGNSASGNNNCRGGGIFNTESSSPHIKNSIIWGNTASSDPGICNDGTDSIPVISFSIVQGSRGNGGAWVSATGTDGGNNLDDDPRFVASGDYRLNTGSQAINAGSDGLYPADAGAVEALAGVTLSAEAKAAINAALGKDLDGNPRRQGTIDMGAYEH